MKSGIALALLGVGGLAAFALHSAHPTTPTPAGGAPVPGPKPAPAPSPIPQTPSGHGLPNLDANLCKAEPNIPPAIMAIWNGVSAGLPRDQWLAAASAIQLAGYPLLANCLRQQAPPATGVPSLPNPLPVGWADPKSPNYIPSANDPSSPNYVPPPSGDSGSGPTQPATFDPTDPTTWLPSLPSLTSL